MKFKASSSILFPKKMRPNRKALGEAVKASIGNAIGPVSALLRCCAVIAALWLACAPARADTAHFDMIDQFPWGFFEDGEVRGIYVDMVREIAAEAKVTPVVRLGSIPRLIERARAGEADFLIGPVGPPQGEVSRPVAPFLTYDVVAVVRTGVPVAGYDSLRSLKSIGVLRRANYNTRFDFDQSLNKVPESTLEGAISKMALGRLDAQVGTEIAISATARKLGMSDALGGRVQLGTSEAWILAGARYRNSAIIRRVERAALALNTEARLQEISRRYTEVAVGQPPVSSIP